MKRFGVAVSVALMLLVSFSVGVFSQSDETADSIVARLRPLLINVQQTVPVTITLSVPVNGVTETVSVPLNLDLNLQIGIADTVSATIEVADTAAPATVTVAEGEAPVEETDQESTSTSVPVPVIPTRPSSSSGEGDTGDGVVGSVRWTILSAEDVGSELTSDQMFVDSAVTSGKFIRVRVEVENIGNERLTVSGFDLVDDRGRSYSPTDSFDVMMIIGDKEGCYFEQLNPSLTKECTFVYEVPADVAGLQAAVSNLDMFDDETELIPLDVVPAQE